jgi:hypothetical protein
MCCFSRNVDKVADTNIFARASREGRQFLIYAMTLSAKEDLAMILPIPTPKAVKEDAVRFINLEKYEKFFEDLRAGFPQPKSLGRKDAKGEADNSLTLKVVEVGSFEASFVPTVKDFARLDERFRLPANVWDNLPQYKNYGFAVFKLKKGAKRIHPMAFEFPRADDKHLFFPTVHIHDGKVHDRANFDHALYCQPSGEDLTRTNWEESFQPAGLFMKVKQAQGLLVDDQHVYRLQLRGKLKNQDTLV